MKQSRLFVRDSSSSKRQQLHVLKLFMDSNNMMPVRSRATTLDRSWDQLVCHYMNLSLTLKSYILRCAFGVGLMLCNAMGWLWVKQNYYYIHLTIPRIYSHRRWWLVPWPDLLKYGWKRKQWQPFQRKLRCLHWWRPGGRRLKCETWWNNGFHMIWRPTASEKGLADCILFFLTLC